MSFDPTTAVPVEETPEFDPTTAAPVEESRLLGQFDPSTAAPMSAEDEVALVNQYLSPDYVAQSKEEFAQLRKLENELKDQGAIPGDFENAVKGVGGIFVSVIDAANSLVTSPLDSWRRSPATLQTGVGKAALGAMELGGFVSRSVMGTPQYKTADTGEYVYKPLGGLAPLISAGDESQKNLVPMTEDDILEYDFQQYLAKKGIEKENKELEAKTAPTEFVQSLFVGSRQETPNLAQAETISLGADPTNLIPLGAGAKTMGMSRGAKLVSSKAARALEKSAIAASEGIDNVSQGVVNKIQDITGLTEQSQKTAATVVATGAGLAGGTAMFMSDADPATKATLTTAATVMPLVFRYGAATLRKVGSGAAGAKIILREAADATNGLDQAARASVLANPAVPQAYKDILENPTRFRPIESTPARLATDPRLGKQTRAIMDRLSNPLIVQGVRGASAVAGGAAKGALANAPFAAAAYGAGENDDAATMLLGGATFGSIGGAANRITGLQQRRAEARASDTARMLIDVELAGGDVAKLSQTYSPQQLGDLASMQGFFRDKVEFVPLSKADFDLNTQALGGAGAAGLFVQAPPGEKARVFLNLDAKREGIVPHELGHALIKSGAIGGMQADSIRAFTTRRYTQAGVEARAREYATTMIANENAAKFPGQNLAISPDAVQAKMDELGQSGLLRGDTDPLDWARDEIFAEDFRQASQTMDFAAIRRNLPAEGSWLGMMEGILGAQANALSISGVRIDPVTGQPDPLFKNNPILATDPLLKKQLGQYLNNYRQWVNHPDQTKARGVRVAPAARPQDLVNNPLVTFHDYGGGVMANEFARIDPATGQAILRDQRDINAETAKRQEQMKALVGSKAISPKDPVLGPKKIKDENGRDTGRTTTRGRLLPQNFDFLNGFAQHQRGFARQLETAAANGESLMVRYHAIGTGDSGSFRVKNLGNLEAITREVIPWGWELTSKGNLLASVLDLTQFRNRALKAINAGDPTIDRLYNNDLKLIEADLKQWMDNHRQDLPGSNKIGEQRRDAINSLIGIATNVNKGANPFSGKIAGPGSAIKSFRLDRMDAATGTGRTGFHFDYDKANGNLLPEVATPLPDLSRDLPTPKGQAMPDVRITPDEAKRQGLAGPFYHGSPDFQGNQFDRSMLARSSGLSRGGFSFTEDPVSAESYSKTKIDSSQAAVDSANRVVRELAKRMDAGLKVKGFADASELPEFNARYVDDISDLSDYFEELANDIPKDLGDRLRAAGKAVNAKPNPVVIEAYLRNPKQMEVGGRKLWVAENPDDIFVSKTTPIAPGQAMLDSTPQFDSNAGAFVIDQGDDVSLPVYQQANRGKPAVDNKGEPKYVQVSYDLINAPRIAEYSGPGPEDVTKPDFKNFAYDITQKGQQQINAAIDSGAVDAAANSVVKFTQEVMQTPEIAAGMGWYSRMRENLLKVLGEEGREILSQLLGATSAKTPVDENFLQAMDAYEGIKSGRYDANRKAYLEMLAAEEKGQLTDIIVRRNYTGKVRTIADQLSKQARQLKGKKKTLYLAEAQKLRDLVKKSPDDWTRQDRVAITMRATDMLPMRSNGKKFNANSMAVLKVISGKWLDNRDSPKTPNFAGNLSGRTVQATIDVWAARFLRETLYEGSGKPWRIQPKSEGAVNNQDFALGQVIMARAAKKLDMNPDDLQAVLWFAEKHRWDKRGWTKNQGAEKSSFDTVFNVFFPKNGKPLTFAEASKIFKKSKE